jgi:molybdopterin synthase sulfur carrier subunit
MAIVKIPTPLRNLTENKTEIQINGRTIIEIIENLDSMYMGIKDKILNNGELKHFVNIYVNGEDIRYINSLETTIDNNDEISIVPAVAGG